MVVVGSPPKSSIFPRPEELARLLVPGMSLLLLLNRYRGCSFVWENTKEKTEGEIDHIRLALLKWLQNLDFFFFNQAPSQHVSDVRERSLALQENVYSAPLDWIFCKCLLNTLVHISFINLMQTEARNWSGSLGAGTLKINSSVFLVFDSQL